MASVFSLTRSLLSLYFYLSSSLSSVDSLLSLAIQTKWTNSHLVALALGFCNPYSRRFGLQLKFFRDLSSVGVVWIGKFQVWCALLSGNLSFQFLVIYICILLMDIFFSSIFWVWCLFCLYFIFPFFLSLLLIFLD